MNAGTIRARAARATEPICPKCGHLAYSRRIMVGGDGILGRCACPFEGKTLLPIDWRSRELGDWRRVFAWVSENLEGCIQERIIWEIRHLRYERRLQESKDWEDRYPIAICKWVGTILDAHRYPGDCMDNVRVARVGDRAAVRAYKKDKAHGCCGYYDASHEGPDGSQYLIGWNYGH